MIKIKSAAILSDDNNLYTNAKEIYLFGIKIYSKFINSNLPIDISNCYPENQQPKMGFNKK